MDFRAIDGAIRRPGRAVIFRQRRCLDFGIELRPAISECLADFPAGKPFNTGEMIETALIAGDEFPDRASGDNGGDRTTKFVAEQFRRPTLFPRPAEFLVEGTVAGG